MFAVCCFVMTVISQFTVKHSQVAVHTLMQDQIVKDYAAQEYGAQAQEPVELVVALSSTKDAVSIGTPVTVRGETVGTVTNIKAGQTTEAESTNSNKCLVQVSIEPENRGLLKQGTLAVVSVRLESDYFNKKQVNQSKPNSPSLNSKDEQLRRTIELLVPSSNKNVEQLQNGDVVMGYPSFSAFWSTNNI